MFCAKAYSLLWREFRHTLINKTYYHSTKTQNARKDLNGLLLKRPLNHFFLTSNYQVIDCDNILHIFVAVVEISMSFLDIN